MEDSNPLPVRGTKKSISCDESIRVCFLRAGLLAHKCTYSFYEYIPSKTFRVAFVTMCIGQQIDTLGIIKLNIQLIRLLLEDTPVPNVEWLVGHLRVVCDV